MAQNTNPLAKFFRQPAIYVRLPSEGKGWEPDSIVMPNNNELPVLPMTAIDEITYRTPDALFNGEAVTSVIKSCCPNIKNPWAVPGTDLDVLLVAIRIASYGHEMDIETRCPACTEEHEFGLDLRTIIDNLRASNFDKPFVKGDLTFHFKPLNYREMNVNSMLQFEQQRNLEAVTQDTSVPEADRVTKLNGMMRQLITVTLKALSQSIAEIRTNDSIVTEQEHIEEFLGNCDRGLFTTLRDHIIELRANSELKPLEIKCPSCQHEYKQLFTLDMANFFVAAS
jgi:Zn finger protein HypA/HybF involved in hydrogenase expression